MFLPCTKKEMTDRGWDRADIILVSGDGYIDSPYIGVAVIGNVLTARGFRVAVIAQPDTDSGMDITRLGEPLLFWGVSAGSVDSMVANHTASGKKRKHDDYTPGGLNNRRPDRALIKYSNLIRRHFKNTVSIVLGGVEASLRRISHYDAWSNSVRKSVLFDAKGDYLIYGMGERAASELAAALKDGKDPRDIRGLCYISKEPREDYLELPSHDRTASDNASFISMFQTFYAHNDPLTARGLFQKQDARYLVVNPPSLRLSTEELDAVHDLTYERDLHPFDRAKGPVTALDTIRFSIPVHRGCYGECRFCAISVHQGRTVTWRSEASILSEVKAMTKHPAFKGVITDAGGPTANMYGFECDKKLKKGVCESKSCLFPTACPSLRPDHGPLIRLLRKIREIPGVRHVFTASGIRYDLVFADKKTGLKYLEEIVAHHVSGQLKIAPEHTEKEVLDIMGKPGPELLTQFKKAFDELSRKSGKKQFLTYYLIAGHPGCQLSHMLRLKTFASEKLKTNPEQVQIFTPTPSTYSTLMYHTGVNPFSGKKIFVEKEKHLKEKQKEAVIGKPGHRSHQTPLNQKPRKR